MTGGPGRANMALSLTSIESASAAHTGGGRGGMIYASGQTKIRKEGVATAEETDQ